MSHRLESCFELNGFFRWTETIVVKHLFLDTAGEIPVTEILIVIYSACGEWPKFVKETNWFSSHAFGIASYKVTNTNSTTLGEYFKLYKG